MERISPFSDQHLKAACKVLGNSQLGLTESEVGSLLQECGLEDVSPEMSGANRLFDALVKAQNNHHVGNHLIMVINRALNPVSYARDWEKFDWRVNELDELLSCSGFSIRKDGKVIRTPVEPPTKEAQARTVEFRTALEERGAHPEILKHCRAELIAENYFCAVLEAIKGVAERTRDLSGLTSDGAELVYLTFSVDAPILAINPLQTETEISEQKGFENILLGLFSAVRSQNEYPPKPKWQITEQDALDILSLVSFVHRKLDGAVRI